jgi:hypothetical protein
MTIKKHAREKPMLTGRCFARTPTAGVFTWVSLEYEGLQEPMAQIERMLKLAREWLV